MEPHIRDGLESIHRALSDADEHTTVSAEQVGNVIVASRQLADLVERLYKRIVDLEKVQNERGEQLLPIIPTQALEDAMRTFDDAVEADTDNDLFYLLFRQ